MQAVLVVVQRHQQHVTMCTVPSVDPPLEETRVCAGLVDDLYAGRRRAE
jgi:hypothetical protein